MPGEFARVLAANAANARGRTAPLSAKAYHAVWLVARTLRWFLRDAVAKDDVEIVRYILQVAYTDVLNPRDDEGFTLPQYILNEECWWNFLMSTATLMDYRAVGQLLRTFGCPIRGDPHDCREVQEEEIRAIKEWLGPPHSNQSFLRRPQPHSRSAQHDPNNADRNLPSVATKWPSEARSPVPRRISHPSGPLTDSQQQWIDLGRLVEQYDTRVRLLRRAEARDMVRYYWQKVRTHVVARVLALHWQERTQMTLAAPGGAGRKRDLAAFQEDFASA